MRELCYFAQQDSPLGLWTALGTANGIAYVLLPGQEKAYLTPQGGLTEDPQAGCALVEAGLSPLPWPFQAMVQEYFAGTRRDFPLPLDLEDTPFRLAVWYACAAIPMGQTMTYGQLAAQLGKPGASRAVGGALHVNPVPLLIPCHRVLSSTGLGGFGGGLPLKTALLAHEKRT